MERKTIFEKIIDREVSAEIIFENEYCLAFKDVQPQAPVHVLVIPKREIPNLAALEDDDLELAGQLLLALRDIARELNLEHGYRVVTNCGQQGGQSVDYLHFHLLAGRTMNWPPG